MQEQTVKALRDLILRRGPAVFLDLIPLLPPDFFKRALYLAEDMEDSDLRTCVLAALAERLPVKERARILASIPPTPRATPSPRRLHWLLVMAPDSERNPIFEVLLYEIKNIVQLKSSEEPPEEVKRPPLKGGGVDRRGTFSIKKGGLFKPGEYVSKRSDISTAKESAASESTVGEPEAPPPGIMPAGGGGGRSGGGAFPGDALAGGGPPPPKKPRSAEAKESKPPAETVARKKKSDFVNLGFSDKQAPDVALDVKETLECGKSYLFWLGVGEKRKGSIGKPESLGVEKLPEKAVLKVALFGFEGELEIKKGADVGELQVSSDGSVDVAKQPIRSKRDLPASELLKTYLFFPVRVPERAGVFRLRCNIYCEQVLIHSRLISVIAQESAPQKVGAAFFKREKALFADDSPLLKNKKALYADSDFVLAASFQAAARPRAPHRLSLLFNSNGNATHGFLFGRKGAQLYKSDASFTEGELSNDIDTARRAMRYVSWGHVEDWDKSWSYRYEKESFDPKLETKRLAKDLARLTVAGYQLYASIVSKLGDRKALSQLMAESGLVQIALKRSAAFILPAALIYDYPFNTQAFPVDTTDYMLCETFDKALSGTAPLEDCDCFKGKCWLKARLDARGKNPVASIGPYVCPSGFWGFRHALGFPLTVDNSDGNSGQETLDAPEEIVVRGPVEAVAGVSTEFDIARRLKHEDVLQALSQPTDWQRAETSQDVFRLLNEQSPHLVYFYCHGGVMGNKKPYIKVGKGDFIDPSNLIAEDVKWSDPRPLVFINGCHTTSVTPEVALSFVEKFVQDAQASGVIGTEITIFEPLARDFAEDCLRRFLGGPPFTEPVPLGEAVRGARLALLKRGNPLGLVYIPFASAGLHLARQ
jgi:hypothetical protein